MAEEEEARDALQSKRLTVSKPESNKNYYYTVLYCTVLYCSMRNLANVHCFIVIIALAFWGESQFCFVILTVFIRSYSHCVRIW